MYVCHEEAVVVVVVLAVVIAVAVPVSFRGGRGYCVGYSIVQWWVMHLPAVVRLSCVVSETTMIVRERLNIAWLTMNTVDPPVQQYCSVL